MKFLNTKIDLTFKTLIPRKETEFWVKKAIREIKKDEKKLKKKIKILDLFAGSGCVGIALLNNTKNTICVFGDIDKNCLKQIKINLGLNKIKKGRAKIVQTDIFSNIRGKFNYIVANPPYVAKERLNEVQPEVIKNEPKIAWYGGKNGLVKIKKFLKQAKNFLTKNGRIFLEIDSKQVEDIEKILKKEGYGHFVFFKDQFKTWRFVEIFVI